MQIHNFDPQTGQYTTSTFAEPDPLNESRWLQPAFSTHLSLPERERHTWPYFVGGAWELRPDFRGMLLYRQADGSAAEILTPGVTPDQAGLTSKPRPSDIRRFERGAWVIDQEAARKQKHDAALADFEKRMALAKSRTAGKADAVAAGILDAVEMAVFRAWAAYQVALVAVLEDGSFPDSPAWPEVPDETALALKINSSESIEAASVALNRSPNDPRKGSKT